MPRGTSSFQPVTRSGTNLPGEIRLWARHHPDEQTPSSSAMPRVRVGTNLILLGYALRGSDTVAKTSGCAEPRASGLMCAPATIGTNAQ